jgi:hypothetical protein
VTILGVDVDAIGADSLGVAAMLLLILLGLSNQILSFVVGIPAEPMQERKSIANRNTDFGSEFDSSPCFSSNAQDQKRAITSAMSPPPAPAFCILMLGALLMAKTYNLIRRGNN